MAIQLEKGCCNMPLRKSCIIIAIYFLVCVVLTVLFDFSANVAPILGLAFTAIANASLLFGAQREHKVLVLVWLIIQIVYFINWPVELLGEIFNFGGYRTSSSSNNVFVAIIVHIIDLVINIYCTLIVYSFYKELKSAEPVASEGMA